MGGPYHRNYGPVEVAHCQKKKLNFTEPPIFLHDYNSHVEIKILPNDLDWDTQTFNSFMDLFFHL